MSARGGPGKSFTIRQIRSGIGYNARQRATLKALGLSGPGRARVVADNAQVRGMVNKIRHLVRIESSSQERERKS